MAKPIRKNNFKPQKKKIHSILVPLDGSKFSIHALTYAINLAKFTGSKIVGIFVVSEDESPSPMDDLINPLSSINAVGYETKMTKYAHKILEQSENRCQQNKIKFLKNISRGNPKHVIVKYSESPKNDIGLIVMGSKGHGHVEEMLLGSVSYYVVHKSKKPVMIVK